MIIVIRTLLVLLFSAAFSLQAFSQQETAHTSTVMRINFLNPGIEYELPVTEYSVFNTNLGIGYGPSYPELTTSGSGFMYLLSPFLDLQYKKFYNFRKRLAKGKNLGYNSGNFFGLRVLSRGNTIASSFTRTSNFDLLIGPIWGLQRSYGKLNFLFDIGPLFYYTDLKGNGNFAPFIFELSVGYNLWERK